jgi:hypothetical protein
MESSTEVSEKAIRVRGVLEIHGFNYQVTA